MKQILISGFLVLFANVAFAEGVEFSDVNRFLDVETHSFQHWGKCTAKELRRGCRNKISRQCGQWEQTCRDMPNGGELCLDRCLYWEDQPYCDC